MAEICPPEHKHGETATCYTRHGCRCTPCTESRAEYAYWRRHNQTRTLGTIDGTGTRRRLRALVAIGWSFTALSEHYGATRQALGDLAYAETVREDSAEKVNRLYDAFSMRVPTPATGYQRGSVLKARRHAARQGWPPPLAWDDEDLDNPHAQPHQPPAMSGVFTLEDA